jgi:hypothetical protein
MCRRTAARKLDLEKRPRAQSTRLMPTAARLSRTSPIEKELSPDTRMHAGALPNSTVAAIAFGNDDR